MILIDETDKPMDDFLRSFTDKYAEWRKSGTFKFSSKVIPVGAAFLVQQQVLPQEQVLRVLRDARTFALTDCVCRTHYQRCDAPRDVCFLLDELGDRAVMHGKARRLSLDDAADRLRVADKHGLVHLALFMPGHKTYALCSCCTCCCHDLQLLLQYHRTDLIARSDYIAETDNSRCNSCGICVERCVFGARKMRDGSFAYNPSSCLGCGLCVSVCPEQATSIIQRESPGV